MIGRSHSARAWMRLRRLRAIREEPCRIEWTRDGAECRSDQERQRGRVVWRGTLFKLALWCGSWLGYSTRGYLEEASRESDTGAARADARSRARPPDTILSSPPRGRDHH